MKLALGTVQFGLNYGISNNEGQTAKDEVIKIFEKASLSGINLIDTAQAYGCSEKIIGSTNSYNFDIVTKVACPEDFVSSLNNLKSDSIYGLMFHNADILLNNQDYWKSFELFKSKGKVKKIGVSVYDSTQIDAILERHDIDIIQIPLNIFDRRLIKSGHLKKLKDKDIEIHVRSIFLQGLVFINTEKLSKYFFPYKSFLQSFHKKLKYANITPLEAAINFVKIIDEVDYIICGVNNEKQLTEIIDVYQKNINIDYSDFELQDENLLNPSNWRI